MEPRVPFDPAALAASVRELAYDARRVLNDPARRSFELRSLSRRLCYLQDQVSHEPPSELSRWLESLSRKIEPELEAHHRRLSYRNQSTPLGVG